MDGSPLTRKVVFRHQMAIQEWEHSPKCGLPRVVTPVVNKYNVAKLQKIQSALCRIVVKLDRTSHVTSFLQKLHWLLITYRILFKYNLITFKTIKFSQPTYLSPLIKTSSLTCGNQLSLSSVCPRKAIDRRGFAMASPIEWNRIPQSVSSQHTITGFRSQLKTYLFRLAYPPP